MGDRSIASVPRRAPAWLAGLGLFFVAPELHAQQDDVVLRAEEQRQLAEGHAVAEGYVDIRSGDVHLTADWVEFWRDEMKVVAEGNVVFEQGDQKIVASRLEADLRTGTGRFHNAHGMAGQDLYFYGDVIEKISEDVYVIERGAFTSCAQPVPRWNFTAGKARIKRDHHVRLHNTFLKVKSLPVFYAPIIYYPIDEDGRSTGFLMPQIGNSTFKGFIVNQGFFWAISRSMDATITYERFSEVGNGVSSEYRYVASAASRGQLDTFFINDTRSGSREYTLNGSANQELPGGFRSVARVDFFSSFDFQQSFQENFNRATRRSKRASGTISKAFQGYNLRVLFDRNDTSFGERVAVREILPRVTFGARPKRIGGTPVTLGFDTEASSLSKTVRNELIGYQRFDVAPTISYPFTGLSWLTFRTSLTGRYTYYTASLDDGGAFVDDEAAERRYYETSLDVRGPTFARIFNTPGNFYAARYKHVIEPQIVWSYRSRVDDFDLVPKFDGNDYIPGTNQLAFSLVNRLLAKRVVDGEEQQQANEMLTWVLSQRYFFDANASLFDRQFSTPFFSPDGTPSSLSPITSRVRFRPSSSLTASWNLDYDVNFGALRSSSLSGSFRGGWGSVNGLWSLRNIPNRNIQRGNVRASTSINVAPGLQASFDTSYNTQTKEILHLRTGVVYNVQCCGFLFELNRFNFGGFRDETTFRFGVTLANVGSFGTSLGGGGELY